MTWRLKKVPKKGLFEMPNPLRGLKRENRVKNRKPYFLVEYFGKG
jgi:hypothetical protein